MQNFGFTSPSEFEIWALVLLLNPAKGIVESKKKDKFQRPACEELYTTLGKEGLLIFREIFLKTIGSRNKPVTRSKDEAIASIRGK